MGSLTDGTRQGGMTSEDEQSDSSRTSRLGAYPGQIPLHHYGQPGRGNGFGTTGTSPGMADSSGPIFGGSHVGLSRKRDSSGELVPMVGNMRDSRSASFSSRHSEESGAGSCHGSSEFGR